MKLLGLLLTLLLRHSDRSKPNISGHAAAHLRIGIFSHLDDQAAPQRSLDVSRTPHCLVIWDPASELTENSM